MALSATGDMQYVVKSGDTLSLIANRYTIGGSAYAPALANYNNISNPNLIQAGMTLLIPQSWLRPVWQGASAADVNSGPNPNQNDTAFTPANQYSPTNPMVIPVWGGAQTPGGFQPPATQTAPVSRPNYLMWVLIGGAALLLFSMLSGPSGTSRRKRSRAKRKYA